MALMPSTAIHLHPWLEYLKHDFLPVFLQPGFPATLSDTGSGDLQPWLSTGLFPATRLGGVLGAGGPDSAIMRHGRQFNRAIVARYTQGESAGASDQWLE